MNRRNDYDWGNILTLWACVFIISMTTAGAMDGTLEPFLALLASLSVVVIGSELVGR